MDIRVSSGDMAVDERGRKGRTATKNMRESWRWMTEKARIRIITS